MSLPIQVHKNPQICLWGAQESTLLLKERLNRVIQNLEESSSQTLPLSVKEKIWTTLSEKLCEDLQETIFDILREEGIELLVSADEEESEEEIFYSQPPTPAIYSNNLKSAEFCKEAASTFCVWSERLLPERQGAREDQKLTASLTQ